MALCYDISALQEEIASPEGKKLQAPHGFSTKGDKGKVAKDVFPCLKDSNL